MKNPMTLAEKQQALADIEAGIEMESKSLHQPELGWHSRSPNGGDPNFFDYQYRRKPEPIENEYEDGLYGWQKCEMAKRQQTVRKGFIRRVRLVEDPTWVEPELKQEKNPWRPIVKGEWPECKPKDLIYIRDSISNSLKKAGDVNWHTTRAIKWKYAED